MALTITGDKILVLSGGTGAVSSMQLRISRIRWVSKTASAGDTCVLSDSAGQVIFESSATGADWSDETDMKDVQMVNGLAVTTLTSGNVYVTLK